MIMMTLFATAFAAVRARTPGTGSSKPLSILFGQLHASMYRAVRLVVDTGIHSKRWTREQAVRYFVDVLEDRETAAITDIERYSVWPGQCCAYMLGKLTFLAQRARAQKAVGYDIRKFHDAMLLPGALPLELLELVYA
jgi:uncharacterized protein (DUF885 family)